MTRRLLMALVIAWPATAARAQGATVQWTRITYVSGATIYLEVGAKAGLTEGASLDVVRAGATIATLRVSAVSSNRAACDIATRALDPVVGDSVRFTATVSANATEAAPARRTGAAKGPDLGIRGRVGVRYLMLAADGGSGLTQPAYDLRLDGQHVAGSPLGLSVDIRAQRTQYRAGSASSVRAPSNVTRVYQAALLWTGSRSGTRVTLGRQMAGALSSVGLFDGVGLDVDRPRWSSGAFLGSQPDAASMGLSSEIREYGAYAQLHSRPGSPGHASLTFGGVGSYVAGAVDREYAFARWTSFTPWLSVYATQELDFNRGWKRAAEGKATTPTATFASVQVTPTRAVAAYAGYDNRRSVRLYRDYLTPELAFDDAFRQGMWGGVTLSAPRHFRVSADRRESRGGSNGTAGANTLTASGSGFTPWRAGARARYTDYTGSLSSGRLMSGALEITPWRELRIEVNGGERRTRVAGGAASPLVFGAAEPVPLTWWGLDADVGVGQRLYVMLSTYRERQGGVGTTQSYVSLSWRF